MITQQELESRLWAAANSLRGPVDPSDFKAYIFPLLFFKRLSDGWDEGGGELSLALRLRLANGAGCAAGADSYVFVTSARQAPR